MRCALLLLVLTACSWAVDEPQIDDSLGLGKRLALLDYLQTVDHLKVPPGADYEQLCLIYWEHHPPAAPDIPRATVTAEDLHRDELQRLRMRLKREYHREAPAEATLDDLAKALAAAEVEEREKARRQVVTGDTRPRYQVPGQTTAPDATPQLPLDPTVPVPIPGTASTPGTAAPTAGNQPVATPAK